MLKTFNLLTSFSGIKLDGIFCTVILFHTTLQLFVYFITCFLPLLPHIVTLESLGVPVQINTNILEE